MHLNHVPQGQGRLEPVVGRAVGKRNLHYQTKGSRLWRFLGIYLVFLAHALLECELKVQSSRPCLFRTAHWTVLFPSMYTEGTQRAVPPRIMGDQTRGNDEGGPASSPKEAPGTGVKGGRVSRLVQQGQKRIPSTRGQQASAVTLVPLRTLCCSCRNKVVSKGLDFGLCEVLGVPRSLLQVEREVGRRSRSPAKAMPRLPRETRRESRPEPRPKGPGAMSYVCQHSVMLAQKAKRGGRKAEDGEQAPKSHPNSSKRSAIIT